MKRVLLITTAIMVAVINLNCTGTKNENPLLQEKWGTPHETAPFDKIKPEHYMPAVTAQIEEAKAEIDAIVNNPDAPTFENTIEALDRNGRGLSRTLGVFYNLYSADTNDELQAIAVELSPIVTAFSNDVSLNEKLFERVKAVYDNRENLNLNVEQAKLLEDSYKGFVRNGANLSEEGKEKYREISGQLAVLSLEYGKNNLAAQNEYELLITNEEDLSGIPQSIRDAAAEAAKAKEKEGYLFTLDAPSYGPFMRYADNRDLRKDMWMARSTLCAKGDANDNQNNVKEIARLRLEMANLLGFETYAEYALDARMAETPEKVNSFLDELFEKTMPFAKRDVKMIQDYANSNGLKGTLQSWDISYYEDKYATEKYDVNDEMTRPYFELESSQEAIFMLANKLYGITFKENKDISVYSDEVKAYEVLDKDGSFLAVFYADFFPRPGKRSGAWMNSFRDASIDENGVEIRPIIINVNNFPRPTATQPSLLSFDEFTTLLHEFGHALHGIFGKGHYSSQTGTSVYRDFVELPSQIMENWATEKEFLNMFAKHYETGEKMPEELIDKLIAKKNHMAAYGQMRQLSFGLLDMAWHTIAEPVTVSVEEFEKVANGKAQVLPVVEGTMMSTAFGHIFSGGYAAGYYSYKWAEVLEADAFNIFKQNGIFDRATAERFRNSILSRGGTQHPMELYVEFAGAEPTVDPLLRKMGLIE